LAIPTEDAGALGVTADNVDKRVLTLQRYCTDAVLLPWLPPLFARVLLGDAGLQTPWIMHRSSTVCKEQCMPEPHNLATYAEVGVNLDLGDAASQLL
jgi:hypothetical protein